MNRFIISIQHGYLTHHSFKNGLIHDENFDDVIIFEDKTKEEVKTWGEKRFGGMRAFWSVETYESAKEEYEKRYFRIHEGIKYKIIQYLDIERAFKALKEGNVILCKQLDVKEETIFSSFPSHIDTNIVLNSKFCLLTPTEKIKIKGIQINE